MATIALSREESPQESQTEIFRGDKKFGRDCTEVGVENSVSRLRNLSWASIPVSCGRAGTARSMGATHTGDVTILPCPPPLP